MAGGLQLSSSGVKIKTTGIVIASGDSVPCCCAATGTYARLYRCSDDVAVDLWITEDDYDTLAGGSLSYLCVCYYAGTPYTVAPTEVVSASDYVAFTDCDECATYSGYWVICFSGLVNCDCAPISGSPFGVGVSTNVCVLVPPSGSLTGSAATLVYCPWYGGASDNFDVQITGWGAGGFPTVEMSRLIGCTVLAFRGTASVALDSDCDNPCVINNNVTSCRPNACFGTGDDYACTGGTATVIKI